jgi:Domain of unknown function (DUF4010)
VKIQFWQQLGISLGLGLLVGVLGGLISSTATAVSFSRRAREVPDSSGLAALAIMVSSAVVYLRVGFEVTLVAPAIALRVLPQLGLMCLAMCLVAALLLRPGPGRRGHGGGTRGPFWPWEGGPLRRTLRPCAGGRCGGEGLFRRPGPVRRRGSFRADRHGCDHLVDRVDGDSRWSGRRYRLGDDAGRLPFQHPLQNRRRHPARLLLGP